MYLYIMLNPVKVKATVSNIFRLIDRILKEPLQLLSIVFNIGIIVGFIVCEKLLFISIENPQLCLRGKIFVYM